MKRLLLGSLLFAGFTAAAIAAPIRALIIDGQNNHNWKQTTPVLKAQLEQTGLFTVDVATAPPKDQDMSGFKPNFSNFQVIISNYNGEDWPQETQDAFVRYIRGGGGLVCFHAADNSFPNWKEYNEMIAIGGWGGRNEKSGPYLRQRDGKWVHDTSPGRGGHHGPARPFLVTTDDPKHPIMAGLPTKWMHAKDELYDQMRGPAINLSVLASAHADKDKGGSGEQEPLLLAIRFGQGRIFHTALGHDANSMNCVGFAVTYQRGTEWAATGKVTQKLPDNFPGPDAVVPLH